MKTEKYISLELSKKIAEVAKEKGIELPESEYWWYSAIGDHRIGTLKDVTDKSAYPRGEEPIYPAYDALELWDLLPAFVEKSELTVQKLQPEADMTVVSVFYENVYGFGGEIKAFPLSHCFGNVLLYLLENDLYPAK